MEGCLQGCSCHFRYQPSSARQYAQSKIHRNKAESRNYHQQPRKRVCTSAAKRSDTQPDEEEPIPKPRKYNKTIATQGMRRDKEQMELQDLMIDPEYDPLFDGIDDDFDELKDPFVSTSSRKGRPPGSAKRTTWDGSAETRYLPSAIRATNMAAKFASKGYDMQEEGELDDFLEEEEEEDEDFKSHFKQHLKYARYAFIQKEQDEVIHIHHKLRATTVAPYAQALALANAMQVLEQQDEQLSEYDPIPSFLRAKKLLAEKWDMIEEVHGSREKTVESILRYGRMTDERQRLLDTWDPSIYEGVHDDEADKPAEDFLSSLLVLGESDAPEAARQEEDFMQDIMPDLDAISPDTEDGKQNGASE